MTIALPESVRYIKNGDGGRWWQAAKVRNQVLCGWNDIPGDTLRAGDMAVISTIIRSYSAAPKATVTGDINALGTLLDHPGKHIWVTFEDGFLYWCTVKDGLGFGPEKVAKGEAHFWLDCDRPWSNRSLGGRLLSVSALPGIVTRSKGYRRTVCKPRGAREILRIIRDEVDEDALEALRAREAYEQALAVLITRLGPQDFEAFVDLVLARSGWYRIATLGGTTEGVDVEAENDAADEIAFVQVKSAASQTVLNDYVQRFQDRRERYSRMIFAVHTPSGNLKAPDNLPVQIWNVASLSRLAVKRGLGEWIASRI